ncbi:MAG: hypothetical protein ACTSXC_07890 [Candidatus Freyarchaeota archaeon]
MREPSKDELLDWLEEVKNLFIRADIWSDRSEKICQQIRRLIESQPSKGMPKDFSKGKDPLFIEGKPPSITLHYPPKGYHEPNKKSIDKKEENNEKLMEWLEHWRRECSGIDNNERKGKPFCPDCPYKESCVKAYNEIKACLQKMGKGEKEDEAYE